MDTITIQTEAYQLLICKINEIGQTVSDIKKLKQLKDQWIDLQETCALLKVSKRTLQSYRDKGVLGFSQINGKIYFRLSDIEEHLASHYNKPFKK